MRGLGIYVATIGIIMSNMRSNCVIVYTSIGKPIRSVLQTEVHSKFLPRLCLQNRFDLAWTSCLLRFLRLSWLLLAPIVVDLIK